jgi:predicted HNH restriction endonuclease
MRNAHRYPRKWKRNQARACKEAAGWKCEKCGIEHGTLRVSIWTGREWPVYMQAAHINHDPENDAPELACVCPTCHWRYYRRANQIPQWMIEKMKHRKLIQEAYCI